MVIYNVTVKIDNEVHDEWLNWMKSKHIPEVMETGYFSDSKMYRVVVHDDDGVTYSIQYTCDSMAAIQQYTTKAAPALQKEHTEKYKDKFVAFRTLLETVD